MAFPTLVPDDARALLRGPSSPPIQSATSEGRGGSPSPSGSTGAPAPGGMEDLRIPGSLPEASRDYQNWLPPCLKSLGLREPGSAMLTPGTDGLAGVWGDKRIPLMPQ